MLVYAGIIPHPPFAIESVGKDYTSKLEKTIDGLKSVGEDLVALNTDTVVIITPHGERYSNHLGIAFHDPYYASLKEFGDMRVPISMSPDMKLIDRLQRGLRRQDIDATLTTNEEVDYGAGVPMFLLEPYFEGKKLVVLSPPASDAKNLMKLGEEIREVIDETSERIAVLCSADMSHKLASVSPGGLHPKAQESVDLVMNGLKDGNTLPIYKMSDVDVLDMGWDGIDALRMFMGILRETTYNMEERSYESPFGIGHLVMIARF